MATALAERPDLAWLSTLPTPTGVDALPDLLPALRAARPAYRGPRLAEGVLTGLPGAVTDLGVSRDGRRLIAAHYGGDAASVIDTATLVVSATASGIAEPYAATACDRAYLRSASISEDSVVAVDLESGAALAARTVGLGAGGLAAAPAGDVLYVARSADDVADIAVIDIESGRVSAIPVVQAAGAAIDAVRVNPAGTRVYAALTTAAGGALVVVEIRTGQVRMVDVGDAIGDIAVSGDDRRVFVTGWDSAQGSVAHCVDVASSRVQRSTAVEGVPVGILACGAATYLAHGDRVSVLEAATLRSAGRIDVGRPVSCLAASPDGTRLYVGDYDGGITALALPTAGRSLSAAS